MDSLILRILLTIAAIGDICIDSYNATLEADDGRIHIEVKVLSAVFAIAVWFI